MAVKKAHPKGLYPLFFTELWERFGFYTIQSILVLYLTKSLLFPDEHAYLIYGTYSSMLYLTPVIGGYLADKVLGFKRAIIIGMILLILGYVCTAIPLSTLIFFIGLGILIVANGLFKPNISSMVGSLYSEHDPRRESGFTLFYMGINIGGLIPPLITGSIVAAFGWHSGFALAIGGLTIGLIIFLVSRKSFGKAGAIPQHSLLLKPKKRPLFTGLFTFGIILCSGLFYLLFNFPKQANLILVIATIAFALITLFFLFKEKGISQKKMLAALILTIISIGFWALYIQAFTSLTLFADRNMSKEFLGFTIDAETTQAFNPLWIILLSPFVGRLWLKLEEKKQNPSIPIKFVVGTFLMALGFLFLGFGIKYFSNDGMTSPWWLLISYLLQTSGELLVSPVGLAMVTRLSPPRLVGMMMGMWFLSLSVAFALGGGLAVISSVDPNENVFTSSHIYSHAFFTYGIIGCILAFISLLFVPYLKRLIHAKNTTARVSMKS